MTKAAKKQIAIALILLSYFPLRVAISLIFKI